MLYSLHELSKLDLAPAHKESIEYILEVLTTNQLYKPGAPDLNSGSSMDNETNNWLQAQWLPTSAHSGKRKRDMIVEDDERAAMEQLLRKVSSDSVPTIAASGGAGAGAGFGAGPRSGQSPLAYEKQLAAAKTASFTARVKQHAKGGFAAKVAQLSAASDSATLRAKRRRKGATTNTGSKLQPSLCCWCRLFLHMLCSALSTHKHSLLCHPHPTPTHTQLVVVSRSAPLCMANLAFLASHMMSAAT